jgi:Carbohydrate binding module (family 6)/Family of unknown function (DUF6298)
MRKHNKLLPVLLSLSLTVAVGIYAYTIKAKNTSLTQLRENEQVDAQLVPAINGVLRPYGSAKRYFTDNSGIPIYLTGSHPWTGLVGFIANDGGQNQDVNFASYLQVLEQNNHNFARMWTEELFRFDYWGGSTGFPSSGFFVDTQPIPYARTGPGLALDGKLKFDLSKYDQSYFDKMRSNIQSARSKNIYVSIMLFEGHALCRSKSPWNWNGHPYNDANNINMTAATQATVHSTSNTKVNALQKAYIKKVIDSTNEFDNVLYEIVNEDLCGQASWQYDLINYIKQYEATLPKQHPVGMTSRTNAGSDSEIWSTLNKADWVSPGRDEDYKTNPPQNNRAKVVIVDTDHLWGLGGDYVWVWKSFTRGLNPIFMEPIVQSRYDAFPADYVRTRRAMGDTRKLATRLDLANLSPRQDLCSTTYCLVNPGQEYVIFQPNDGTAFTVQTVANTYAIEWINATTSQTVSQGQASYASGTTTFVPPSNAKFILYLKRVSTPTQPIVTPRATALPVVTTAPIATPITGVQSAYKSVTVPGIIQAEDFDNGGRNIAYLDSDEVNIKGEYRQTGVDIRRTGISQPPEYIVAATQQGEWLEYTVDVLSTGSYQVEANVALNETQGTFHIETDQGINTFKNITGPMKVVSTGGWDTFTNIKSQSFTLQKGKQVIRLVMDSGNPSIANINYLKFLLMPNTQAIKVEAESYNQTGGNVIVKPQETVAGVLKTATYIYRLDPGDWVKYAGIDLTGKTKIDLYMAPRASAGQVEIRTGSQTGVLIGKVTTDIGDNTMQTYKIQSATLSPIAGVQDVYVVGSNYYDIGRIDWLEFK